MSAGTSDIDLRAIWGVLLRRKWLGVAVLAAAMVVGAVVTARAPRIYRAVATVLIDQDTPQVLANVREVYDLGASAYRNTQEYYQTQYRIIKSRPVAEKVATLLGIDSAALAESVRAAGPAPLEGQAAADPLFGLPNDLKKKLTLLSLNRRRDRDGVVEALDKLDVPAFIEARIQVEPIKDSRLVEIAVEDIDPERAALFANAVADAYEQVNLDQKVDFTDSAVDWLSDQMRDLKDKLEKSEMVLYDFKKANNIVDVSMEDRRTMISETLSQLNQSLSQAQARRLALESQRSRVQSARQQGGLPDEDEAITSNNFIQDLKGTRFKLEQEDADLALKYTEDHPKLVAVRRKLALVQASLNTEMSKILGSLETKYQEALDTERRLRGAIDKVKAEALKLNKKEIKYKRLEREADNNQALYDMVLKRQKEAELTQMLKVNNVRKYEAALAPESPVRPRVMFNLLIALVLGLAGGLGLMFLVDFLDNSIKTQTQVEQLLGLPFLGIIPAIRGEKSAKIIDIRERDHYIVAHPKSSVAECCRIVRTNLLFMSPEKTPRLLLATSSGPREGKSTTVVNLAVTMAQAGTRVVMVDTDMRRPRLHKTFEVDNERGVTNVVVGDAGLDQVIRSTGMDDLDIVTCGSVPPNPAELLHADTFKQTVQELARRYDRVLFDSPPVGAVSDALVLGSMVDGIVLVVQAGNTSWQAALQARRRLEDVGGKVFGVVLNEVNLDDKRSGEYYQYYYHYYRSGYSDEDGEKKKRIEAV